MSSVLKTKMLSLHLNQCLCNADPNFSSFQVDFDKTRHLSAKVIKKREKEQTKWIELIRKREEQKRLEKEEEEKKKEEER